jgi:hypothetical protein
LNHTYVVQNLPTFSGWRSCWMEIVRFGSVHGICGDVLTCSLHWQDGSKQECYVTSEGELILHLQPEANPRCPLAEHPVSDPPPVHCERTIVSVSHTLTAEEISSGWRGAVYGNICSRNNERKVSHVVGIDKDDLVACARLVAPGESASFVRLPPGRIRKYAPELIREYQWRIEERWQSAEARTIVTYLAALFQRSSDADAAVRKQMHAVNRRIGGAPDDSDVERRIRNTDVLEQLVRALESTV